MTLLDENTYKQNVLKVVQYQVTKLLESQQLILDESSIDNNKITLRWELEDDSFMGITDQLEEKFKLKVSYIQVKLRLEPDDGFLEKFEEVKS